MATPNKINASGQASMTGLSVIGVGLFLILVWGSAYTLISVAVRSLSPEWLVAYRMIIGSFVVFLYAYFRGHRLPPLRDVRWIWYCAIAICGACLPFILIAQGQKIVASGLSSILIGTMPLITIILAHFFTSEKLNPWKLIGFLLGFIGIIILFLPENLSLTLVKDWRSQLLILIASALYAITTIITSRAPETPSALGAAMMLIIGAVLATMWALFTDGPPPIPDMSAFLSVLGLALGSTGVAMICYFWVIEMSGPSLVARINYFVPICSVILGVLFLDEELDWRVFAALFTILLGVIISRIGDPKKRA